MKFLLRPEFLTALAVWVCSLGMYLGWDLPAELVFGGASLVSIAAGGVAVQRNKTAQLRRQGVTSNNK